MADIDNLKFFNTFAPWLSAVGTISAVIVSLYLARRDHNIRLSVKAKICDIVELGGGPDNVEKVVVLSATNIGFRKARLTSFYWKCGHSRSNTYVQLPPSANDSYSTKLPVELSDGAEAIWVIPLEQFEKSVNTFFSSKLSMKLPKLQIGNLKIGVFTTTGDNFENKADNHLKKWIVATYKKNRVSR